MTGEVNFKMNGQSFSIKEGDSVQNFTNNKDLKKLAPLFDLIDNARSAEGGDGKFDSSELSLLQKLLSRANDGDLKNYDIEKLCKEYHSSGKDLETYVNDVKLEKIEQIATQKPSTATSFNNYMQKSAEKYKKEDLEKQFSTDTYEIKSGDTLYKIIKDALKKEGKPHTPKDINERMAQVVALNGIKT